MKEESEGRAGPPSRRDEWGASDSGGGGSTPMEQTARNRPKHNGAGLEGRSGPGHGAKPDVSAPRQKRSPNPIVTSRSRADSRGVRGPHVRCETTPGLEESVGECPQNLGVPCKYCAPAVYSRQVSEPTLHSKYVSPACCPY